jgi:ribonuclease HI
MKGKKKIIFDHIIYTDGAYSRKHDEGAFAYVICDGSGKELKRNAWKIVHETNNRAELKAIIAGLYHLPGDAKNVAVVSDSMYALNTLSKEWSRNANTDLFPVHDRIVSERGLRVRYFWVKGHSGDKYNEICDQMCNDVLGYDANAEFEKYRKRK